MAGLDSKITAHILIASIMASGESTPEPLVAAQRAQWECLGFRVHYVGLNASESDAALVEQYRAALAQAPEGLLIAGGFSRAARIAAGATGPRTNALILFGYPFHRRGAPQERHGLQVLKQLKVPVLIVQGSRDSHGSEQEVRGYELGSNVALSWLADGNHRWQPRQRSGFSLAQHKSQASQVSAAFLCRILDDSGKAGGPCRVR